MNQENISQNLFKKIQNFIFKNYIQLIISLVILLIIFIGFQIYNYVKIQDIKNSSISFFDIIQDKQNDLSSLENLINDDNIFSILSKLKLIQQNNENKNNNFFKKIQNFIFKNYLQLIISLVIFLIIFIGYQTFDYFKIRDIKNSSISFFDIIQENNDDISSLENLIEDDTFFSILSKLKLIQQNNENKNFSYSNELYKELIADSDLNSLYKSSIAANASYTMINATYEENTNNYLNDISGYINNISDDLDAYFSIKKELEYLLIVTEIDLNKSEYNNSKALDKYNEIFNSNLVSASIKERVKKIHEFQLYK